MNYIVMGSLEILVGKKAIRKKMIERFRYIINLIILDLKSAFHIMNQIVLNKIIQ